MFSLTSVISLITGLIPLAQKIGQIWESSGGFAAIAREIMGSPALKSLEEIGAQLFPLAAKEVQKVLAAIHLGYPTATKWLQQSLNALERAGVINFGDPLKEDGIFGPKTFAAVVVLQAKAGIKPTGAVADAEYAAINSLLEKAKQAAPPNSPGQ